MKLTERLDKIASLVTEGSKIADIGTDHGYIPVYLLTNNKINFAILSDINKGPLDNASKLVEEKKLNNKVDLRLGPGLEVLNSGEVDEIIIAGMGGILIADILKKSKKNIKDVNKIILQPMQASDELRKYLYSNDFIIIDEYLVKEDFRIYEIIEVKCGNRLIDNKDNIDSIYYDVPEKLIFKKDPLLAELINKKIKECESILEKLGNKTNDSVINRKVAVEKKVQKLYELKKNL